MAVVFGPTFGSELVAAGCSSAVATWGTDGSLVYVPGATPDQMTTVQRVIAAHDPTKQIVPSTVTNYQARTILIQRGLIAEVDAAIRGADQTVQANQIALAAWDYANTFNRTDPLISAMAQVLSLSSADVDALFIAAAAVGN